MQNKQAILELDGMYHIYNRANGSERLFVSDENYRFFLKQFQKYIEPIAETFCYCLMPNHFHFLVRIKNQKELKIVFTKGNNSKDQIGFENLSGLLSKQFSNLFNAYSKAFNKQHYRKGSLFMRPFKRKVITDSNYLIKLIHYIHYNPTEAGLSETLEGWKYSSYQALVSNKRTAVNRKEVLELFDGVQNFKYCHTTPPKLSGIEQDFYTHT